MVWNNEEQDFLITLQQEITDLIDIYKQQYIEKHNILCRVYKLPTIFLSSLSSFLSVANYGYFNKDQKYISLIVGILNMLISTINVIENFKQIDKLVVLSENIYKELTLLSNDITMCLFLQENERPYKDGLEAVNNYYNRFTTITKNMNIMTQNTHHHLYINHNKTGELIELKKIKSHKDLQNEIKI